MAVLANRVRVATATTGTGTITLGAAESGFRSFADGGIANGAIVSYVIEDGANFEFGWGTYSSTGPTLARTTIHGSSNAGAAINLSGSAKVFISPLKEDLQWTLRDSWTFSTTVSSIDFTDLGSPQDIIIVLDSVTRSTTLVINAQVSSDNGVSFYSASGDYFSNPTENATTAFTVIHSGSTAASTAMRVIGFGSTASIKHPGPQPQGAAPDMINRAEALNALRILTSTGTLTGGSIEIWGR